MVLRPFDLSDTDEVVDLWQQAGLTRPWNDPHKDILRKLQVQPELFVLAVDEQSGSVLGSVMAGYDGHRGWVNYLAVSPPHHGQGVGRVLMQEVQEKLQAMGCCKINLQIRHDNAPARAFYHAIGFNDDEVVSMGKRLIED